MLKIEDKVKWLFELHALAALRGKWALILLQRFRRRLQLLNTFETLRKLVTWLIRHVHRIVILFEIKARLKYTRGERRLKQILSESIFRGRFNFTLSTKKRFPSPTKISSRGVKDPPSRAHLHRHSSYHTHTHTYMQRICGCCCARTCKLD